jgi:hypothetical protein
MLELARIRRFPGGGHLIVGLSNLQALVLLVAVVVVIALLVHRRRR